MLQATDMNKPMPINRARRLLLAAVVAALSGPASANPDEHEFLAAFAEATIAAAVRGEPSALGSLSILLDMPAPWRDTVLGTVERSDLIAALVKLGSARPGLERREIDALSQRIAELQGQESRAVTSSVAPGAVAVDLGSAAVHWLLVAGLPAGPGELLVQSPHCTPDIVAFPGTESLPIQPLNGQVRLSAQLTSISYSGPMALRIKPGDCEDEDLTLQLSHAAARIDFAVQSVDSGSASAPIDRFPAIAVDQLTVIPLERRSAQTFAVPTQPGFVYEVYAAPMTMNLDPVLIRADSEKLGDLVDASDDNGWELGAHLTAIVGTGRLEKFAVIRNASSGQGDVALLVRREAVPTLEPSSTTTALVSGSQPTWRRMRLPAGTWSIRTGNLSRSFDPMLTVYDGISGRELETNDDAHEGDPTARVTVELNESREIVIRLDSVNGEGECTLEIAPSAKPAAARESDPHDQSPPVST
jgi:hypothetical protein